MLKTTILCIWGAAIFAALPASGASISPDGTWHEFVALTVGGPVTACTNYGCAVSTTTINPGADTTTVPPWTFFGPASLFVLDLFLSGDQFEVFDNGVSLGDTSLPGAPVQCGTPNIGDIGCAIANPGFSRGVFLMGAGVHSITMNYLVTTYVGHTGAALQLNPVPEPATGLPFAIGFGVWAASRARRSNRLSQGAA